MAVDWLKQVIDNKDLKDTDVITLAGGQTVPIGDVRNLTKAQLKTLSDREANLVTQEAALKKNLETLQLAQAETAKLFTDLQNERQQTTPNNNNNNQPDPFDALEKDPSLGPLAKASRQQSAALEEIKTKALQPIVQAQRDMANAYVRDRIEDLYERIVPDAKKSTISLDSILKVANDNGLKTATGIPDIRRAYQAISTKPIAAEDLEAQLKAAREEGRREAADAARLRVPRPGIGAVSGRPESAFKPTTLNSVCDALTETLNAEAKDADIWSNFNNRQAQ